MMTGKSIIKNHIHEERSTLISRNVTVLGRRTSVRLEPEMWMVLKEISKRERCRIHDICSLIEIRKNPKTSLTAAIRVFLMLYYRAAATEEGHVKAGHGNFNHMMSRARLSRENIMEHASERRKMGFSQTFLENQAVEMR